MNVKKIARLVIPMSVGLIFSAQAFCAEKKSNSVITLQTDSLKGKVIYSAKDSTKLNDNKTIISLFGKATLNCKKFDLKANEIVFNKKTQKVTAKDFVIFHKRSKKSTTGSYGEFSVN